MRRLHTLWVAAVACLVAGARPAVGAKKCKDKKWHSAKSEKQDCAWVADKPKKRCKIEDKDGKAAKKKCKATCSKKCQGVAAVVALNEDDASWRAKGKKTDRGCAWVAKKKTPERCAKKGAVAACATTCAPFALDTFRSCDAVAGARDAKWFGESSGGGGFEEFLLPADRRLDEDDSSRELERVAESECTVWSSSGGFFWDDDFGGGEFGAFDGAMAEGAPENGAPAPAPAPAPGGDRGDFSETNTQEAGVEEPDVIKTVGDYVYRISAPVVGDEDKYGRSLCERRLSVLDDSDAEAGPRLVGSVPFGDLVTEPDGMLVDGDVLLVYGRTWLEYVDDADTFWGDWPAPYWWWWDLRRGGTVVLLFDVSDPTTPKLLRRQIHEGSPVAARRVGATSYVVVSRTPNWGEAPRSVVPLYRDERIVGGELRDGVASKNESVHTNAGKVGPMVPVCACDELYFASGLGDDIGDYTTVLAFTHASPEAARSAELAATTVATRSDSAVYASTTALYLTQVRWNGWQTGDAAYTTFVSKFALDGMDVAFETRFKAPGRVLNQFSMSEADGHFRVATTTRINGDDWTSDVSSGVYVFDAGGAPVGAVGGLAPGESIKSARFTATRLYLVTFVETDPLFVIALDDPAEPRVLGELKVPGYSAYLHQLNATHLIGLGRDTELTREGWVVERGLQLSLFDVSDELQPERDGVAIIGDRGTQSPALDDHHAFQCWPDDKVVAFPLAKAEDDDDDMDVWRPAPTVFQGVALFGAAGAGLELLAEVTHLPDGYFEPEWVCNWGCPDDDAYVPDLPDDDDEDWWSEYAYEYVDEEGSGSTYSGSWSKRAKTAAQSGLEIDRVLQRGDHVYTFSANAVLKSCPLSPDGCPDGEAVAQIELNDVDAFPAFAWGGL